MFRCIKDFEVWVSEAHSPQANAKNQAATASFHVPSNPLFTTQFSPASCHFFLLGPNTLHSLSDLASQYEKINWTFREAKWRAGGSIVLYIFIFIVLDIKLEDKRFQTELYHTFSEFNTLLKPSCKTEIRVCLISWR